MSPFSAPSIFNSATTSGTDNLFTSPSKIVSKMPLMGLFQDDVWHCNCNPRQPAAFFEVKKDGPTKGKWFYTCQSKQCRMFLWKEKAVGRESKVVLSNHRSEAEPFRRHPQTHDISRDTMTNVGPKNWIQNLGKTDKSLEEDDSDEFGVSQEDELNLIAASTSRINSVPPSRIPTPSSPETPRKATKTNHFATPGSKRKRDEDSLPTPHSLGHVSLTPTKPRRDGDMWDGNEHTPFATPTPRRFREESAQASNQQSYDILDQVMDLLKSQNIDDETGSKLKEILAKHELRVSGILKGREAIRTSLKKKDETITELKQRINALEVDQGMNKSIIKHLKDSLATSIGTKKS